MEHMEPMMPNQDEEAEMMRKMRDMEGLPPEEKGMPRSRKMVIAGAAIAGLLLLALMLFLMGGRKPEKHTKTVPASDRGLMQAETIRTQKEQLDEKNRKRADELEWVKRFQAMRDRPPVIDESPAEPDPIALYPEAGKPQTAFSDIKPSDPQPHTAPGWNLPVGPKARVSPVASSAPAIPSEKPTEFRIDSSLAQRMTDEYQKALAFNSSEQLVFTRDRLERDADKGRSGSTSGGQKTGSSGMGHVVVSAGQELTAVLNESLDSDYPSVAKATLTSPPELNGSTILISYALGQERVTAQILKLILPAREGERAREQTLAAVVKNGLPGLGGDVSHHWIPQIAAGVANAGLTAGALYYAAQNQNKDLGTAVLVAPMIEQSVQGVMKPINYLGRDRPVTVQVPAGTEFKLLVTEGFEVDL
jgi:type IV secretory pathway VirB10-like protein